MAVWLPLLAVAQTPSDSLSPVVYIKNIVVKGNKKTKDYIITREIQFKTGDSLVTATIPEQLEQARQQVYNTTLFNEVKLTPHAITPQEVEIEVEVKERWYIFPVPQFQIVDRNLNEWLKTYKGDLNRVNYGLKLVHYNLSGRRDPLRIFFLNGFTRNIAFSYTMPGSNPSLTEGFSVSGGYSQNRQVAYIADSANQIRFFPNSSVNGSAKLNSFVRSTFMLSGGYILRRGILSRHTFTLTYTNSRVNDSVVSAKYNPNFFGNGKASANYIDFTYNFFYNNVNNTAYPLYGKRYSITLQKRGLGFSGGTNMLSIEGTFNRLWKLGGRWYADIFGNGKIKLPFKQAYTNQRALGFGESYLRGQEYFVIDGVWHALLRNTLRYKLLSFNIPMPIKSKSHPRIPFTIFAKTYGDVGYAYSTPGNNTYLNNRLLYTGGFGIDILTLYDVNLRLEYSFNQQGQRGFFIHTQTGF